MNLHCLSINMAYIVNQIVNNVQFLVIATLRTVKELLFPCFILPEFGVFKLLMQEKCLLQRYRVWSVNVFLLFIAQLSLFHSFPYFLFTFSLNLFSSFYKIIEFAKSSLSLSDFCIFCFPNPIF